MKLLSIVVPSYNQGAFIRETLDSILSQDYRPIEVLVLDGDSKDETVEVLKSYDAPELRWWSEHDRGVVDAVNKGLALACGEFVAIQSSDDVYLLGAFRTAVEVLSADAYSVFEEQGVLSPTAGARFRDEVLARGGSRPALEYFVAFRGRPPQLDALLRHNGMTMAS